MDGEWESKTPTPCDAYICTLLWAYSDVRMCVFGQFTYVCVTGGMGRYYPTHPSFATVWFFFFNFAKIH